MAAVGFSGRNGLQWSSELTDIDELSPSQSVYYALLLQLRCVIQGASKLHDFKDGRNGEEKLLSGLYEAPGACVLPSSSPRMLSRVLGCLGRYFDFSFEFPSPLTKGRPK